MGSARLEWGGATLFEPCGIRKIPAIGESSRATASRLRRFHLDPRATCARVTVLQKPMATVTRLHINGRDAALQADGDRTLLSVLRDDLQLTGCKPGCGEGQCGACTVLVDGKPVRSCRTPAGSVGESNIRTIEGLEQDGGLHPVQQAFLDADALQCGYCTCGMVLSAVALLEEHPQPTDEQFLAAMDGNICRCGVYNNIRDAVKRASEILAKNP